MAFNTVARPSDHRVASSGRYDNIFYEGESPSFTLTGTADVSYEVRNYYGVVVASGTVSGSPLTLSALPLGWYKLYFRRTAPIASPWFDAGGELMFVVLRHGVLAEPGPSTTKLDPVNGGDPQFEGYDIPSHGVTQMGPHRLRIRLDGNNANDILAAGYDSDYLNTFWTTDSARPLVKVCSFPESIMTYPTPPSAGTLTLITNTVQGLAPKGVTLFEGMNEPNGAGASATAWSSQQGYFADTVHAAHASAQVAGPCSVKISDPTQLTWMRDVLASVGSKIDVISFHNYNGGIGSIPAMRKNFDNFVAMLTSVGQHTKPRFNTEAYSNFMGVYGSFEPRYQAQMTLLEMHMNEQYGVPKEQAYAFYDLDHGFSAFPSYWIANNGGERHPGPLMALVRVWSEELFGKNYAAQLDFGSENSQWLGSRFTNSTTGASVVALQSDGRRGQVALEVTGSGSLTLVSPWGATSTLTPVGGLVTVDVDTLPVYVRTPSGTSVSPVTIDYGVEVAVAQRAKASSLTTSSATYAPANAVNGLAGTDDTAAITTRPFRATDSGEAPGWWQVDFPTPTRFDTVVVRCPRPWQLDSALLDFDVQIWDGSTWQTVATDSEPTNTLAWTSSIQVTGCYVDSYWSRRNVFYFRFAKPGLTTTKLRVYARDMTYGGGATLATTNGAGTPGSATGQTGPKRLCLEEVGVYLSPAADGGTAVEGQPIVPLRGA